MTSVFTKLGSGKFWIVSYRGKVIAYVRIYEYHKHLMLMNLHVTRQYRLRKVGSSLIKHLATEYAKPIYVLPTSSSWNFYTRIGFVLAWKCKGHPLEGAQRLVLLK
jgi:N-acetylglutamate synthase-like GNAT family acetyltransferase